jgi:hypothetical protein
MALVILTTIGFGASALGQSSGSYTVNGKAVAPEMRQLLSSHGFAPGNYYIDVHGNFGLKGQPPTGNIDGGAPRNWSGTEPTGVRDNPYAQAYVNGVVGVRVFWVYSPSIFSESTGGSSGYYHICSNNIYHRSSEGAINVGGEYDSQTGHNKSWAGAAGTSQGSGRWTIESGANGPMLTLFTSDGGVQRVLISTMLRGRWKAGQVTYVVEAGKASC